MERNGYLLQEGADMSEETTRRLCTVWEFATQESPRVLEFIGTVSVYINILLLGLYYSTDDDDDWESSARKRHRSGPCSSTSQLTSRKSSSCKATSQQELLQGRRRGKEELVIVFTIRLGDVCCTGLVVQSRGFLWPCWDIIMTRIEEEDGACSPGWEVLLSTTEVRNGRSFEFFFKEEKIYLNRALYLATMMMMGFGCCPREGWNVAALLILSRRCPCRDETGMPLGYSLLL